MAIQNANTNILGAAPNIRVSILDRLSSVDLCAFNSPDYAVIPGFCDVHNIPVATNIATAEMLIHGLERGDLDWRQIVNKG